MKNPKIRPKIMENSGTLTLSRGGGGGKFAYPLGDSFFRTEERFPKTPFFVTFNDYLFHVFPEDFISIPPLDQELSMSG